MKIRNSDGNLTIYIILKFSNSPHSTINSRIYLTADNLDILPNLVKVETSRRLQDITLSSGHVPLEPYHSVPKSQWDLIPGWLGEIHRPRCFLECIVNGKREYQKITWILISRTGPVSSASPTIEPLKHNYESLTNFSRYFLQQKCIVLPTPLL